jgi:urea transport system permease protein
VWRPVTLTLLCLGLLLPLRLPAQEMQATLDALAGDAPLQAARQLLASGEPGAALALQTLLEGQLYRRTADNRVFAARRDGAGYLLADPVSGEARGSATRRELRQLRLDNAQREGLRLLLARAALTAPDAQRRLAAVQAAFAEPLPGTVAVVRELLPNEPDSEVAAAMQTLLALADLDSASPELALASVAALADSGDPAIATALQAVIADDTRPAALRDAAAAALAAAESRARRNARLQTLFFGLSLGSVLALAAVGLAISFGVMGVINMAHGEFIMLGAYTTWVVQQLLPDHTGLALLTALPAAFLVSAAVGVAIERSIIRHLYGRPLETLLATFGISLILQQAVRSLFSPLNRAVVTPDFMSGTVSPLTGLELTLGRLYILLFCLALFVALWGLLRHTRFGLQLRAVAQNRDMARCLGVRTARIDALTFGLGAGLAGLAGVALSQLTNVGPNLGQAYIIDSFMVVVTGGVGNLWGTLAAGLSLGVLNKLLEPVAGSVLAKILILVAVILFIQWRPRGLFPQRGRAAQA